MSIELMRGQRFNIADHVGCIAIHTTWAADNQDDFDIDTSVFLLGADRKVLEETDFVFYNNPSARGCVSLYENINRHNEALSRCFEDKLTIDLKGLAEDVQRIAVVMSIYEPDNKKQSFAQISKLNLAVFPYDKDSQSEEQELFRFCISDRMSEETAVVLCEFYRYQGKWKVSAVGFGYQAGLRALCDLYNITVLLDLPG